MPTKEKTAKRGSTQRKKEKRNDKIENIKTHTKALKSQLPTFMMLVFYCLRQEKRFLSSMFLK